MNLHGKPIRGGHLPRPESGPTDDIPAAAGALHQYDRLPNPPQPRLPELTAQPVPRPYSPNTFR